MGELRPEFIESLRGTPLPAHLAETLATTAPAVSVRYNPARLAAAGLSMADMPGEPVPWWPEYGRYLAERPTFTFDPALHQGLYYVQDASSMALAAAVRRLVEQMPADEPIVYLDACAAPGGKTGAAIDALPQNAFIVANEYDYRRAAILAENVAKWGSGRTMVTRGDTARYSSLRDTFDIIAVDAPCSGEGMMRKDAEAAAQWSPSLVAECAARQWQIIENLWPALRPGGYLIYSTCTFNRLENEDIVHRIIDTYGAENIDVGLTDYPGVMPAFDVDLHAARFIPGEIRGEGLFMAVLRKPGEGRRKPAQSKHKPDTMPREAANWLIGKQEVFIQGDTLHLVDADLAGLVDTMRRKLDVLAMGIAAATIKGRDLVPRQELALARNLNVEAFPQVELDRDQALAYLRREAVAMPEGTPRGIVLTTYGHLPLGFVKNLGNRANNLYPAPWRILRAI